MRRVLLIALTLLALGATAAPRRPAAVLSDTHDDEPGPAPPASTAPDCPDDDKALVRGLAWAFEPAPVEIRVIAVLDLALLGDLRALNPLAHLIFDAQPAVQAAAVAAVSQFSSPRAEEILSNVVRHPSLPDPLKVQAIDALVFQRSPAARELLRSLAEGLGTPPTLREAARQAIENWGPPP